MADPSGVVQAAFIARYRSDSVLQGLLSGYNAAIVAPEWNILDQGGGGVIVPVFPYIYVHPITMQFPGTVLVMGTDALDVYMQINIYTRFEGFEEARVLRNRCYALTHMPAGASAFPMTGFTNPWTTYQNGQELEEVSDGLVQHIADRVRLWVSG